MTMAEMQKLADEILACDGESTTARALALAVKSLAQKYEPDEAQREYFERVWNIYPRKVNKELARKTFFRKLRNLDGEKAKVRALQIYELLTRQIEVWANEHDGKGRAMEYIPHCASWLNANFEDGRK